MHKMIQLSTSIVWLRETISSSGSELQIRTLQLVFVQGRKIYIQKFEIKQKS